MEAENSQVTGNLSQRAYLITKLLGSFGKSLRLILAINSFFLVLGWLALYSRVNILDFVVFELSLATAVTTVSYVVTGRRAYRELREWNEDYLDQAYVLVFETTIPLGNTTGEKVVNLAKAIFPELIPGYLSSPDDYIGLIKSYLKKKILHKPQEELIIPKNINYKGKSYSFDAALKTADGYFIVKSFDDKVVTLEDLKQLVQIVQSQFKDKYHRSFVFRLVCVAKQYDQSFLEHETLERHMAQHLNSDFKVDLLIEEKKGYSVLWVDH